MNKAGRFKILMLQTLSLLCIKGQGQCGNCGTLINSNAVTSYTAGSGQCLQVATNFTYTGTIYLSGGTVCNAGTIRNMVFNAGTFNNYGSFSRTITTALSLSTNGKIKINNYTGSKFVTGGDLTITSTTNDSVYINVHNGASFNVSNNFTVNCLKSRFEIGLPATTGTNSPYITSFNVNGDMVLKKDPKIYINDGGFLNVTGKLLLPDDGSRTLVNYGEVYVDEDLIISGNGQGNTTLSIENHADFSVMGAFTCNITNADVKLINFEKPAAKIEISGSSLVETSTFTLDNRAFFESASNFSLALGNVVNESYFTAYSLLIDGGIFDNQHRLIIIRDLNIASSSGTLNNDGTAVGIDNFDNYGTVTLGKKSVISTRSFDNRDISSYISGPADILNASNQNDTTLYARLIIDQSSGNTGTVTGFLLATDLTYSGGPPKMDFVDPASFFGPDVIFDHRCDFELEVGYLDDAEDRVPRSFYCQGEDITISLSAYVTIVSGPNWSFSGSCSGTGSSSNPPSLTITNVQTSGTVTATGTYFNGVQNCSFTLTLPINLGNGSITATSPLYFGVGNQVTLNSTVTAGFYPCTFTWTPNVFFTVSGGNNQEDPIVEPMVSLTYTVNFTDAFGCVGSTTVMVISEPFAVPEKALSGQYYKLMQNLLFFKYDGQYDVSGLVYNVYDKTNSVVASNSNNNIVNLTTLKPGDNRYTLNAATLPVGSYVLEVINEKQEKMYWRFKK